MVPQFRPLNEDLSGLPLYIFGLFLIIFIGLLALYLLREYRLRQTQWGRFKSTARDRKLNTEQAQYLEDLARNQRLKNPMLLLTALSAFDRQVGSHAARLSELSPETQAAELETIGQIRQTLGFDRLRPKQLMQTTRQLQPGQNLMIWPEGDTRDMQTTCVVVERDEGQIVAVQVLKKDERHLRRWKKGERFQVMLSQDGFAEYGWITELMDVNVELRQIVMGHSEKVERTQARDFYRWDTNFPVVLYRISQENYSNPEEINLENAPRIEGSITNISGGGMSLATRQSLPPNTILVTDPTFHGDFPIAGIACSVLNRPQEDAQMQRVHLRFLELPIDVEKGIISTINRLQIGLTEDDVALPRQQDNSAERKDPT
jgi:c-di-GMP-binding flagellar brake protein YcgR